MMKPLHSFITSRELERRLPAMIAHLKPAEEKLELHFAEAMVATLWFQWESKKTIARISLWESGDCDVEVVEMSSGEFRPFRHKRCQTKEEFYQMLREMIATMSQLEEIAESGSRE